MSEQMAPTPSEILQAERDHYRESNRKASDRILELTKESAQYRGIIDRVVNAFLGTLKCPAFDLPTGLPDSSAESEAKMRGVLKMLVQEHCGLTKELAAERAAREAAEASADAFSNVLNNIADTGRSRGEVGKPVDERVIALVHRMETAEARLAKELEMPSQLLDVNAICEQRDALLAEVGRLREQLEELRAFKAGALKLTTAASVQTVLQNPDANPR